MGKLYFLCSIILFSVLSLGAQNSFLIENATRFASGNTVDDITAGALIKNISAQSKRVKVRSEVMSMPEGAATYFCWKECYTPAITDSPDFIEIPAGETANNFFGYYRPNGISGEATIRFIFYDLYSPTDSVQLDINFSAVPTSLRNIRETGLSVFPNPANDEVAVKYSKLNGYDNWLDLVNMLGNKIQSVRLSGSEGVIRIETAALKPGVYFYSLRGSGHPQRLIIKH